MAGAPERAGGVSMMHGIVVEGGGVCTLDIDAPFFGVELECF